MSKKKNCKLRSLWLSRWDNWFARGLSAPNRSRPSPHSPPLLVRSGGTLQFAMHLTVRLILIFFFNSLILNQTTDLKSKCKTVNRRWSKKEVAVIWKKGITHLAAAWSPSPRLPAFRHHSPARPLSSPIPGFPLSPVVPLRFAIGSAHESERIFSYDKC